VQRLYESYKDNEKIAIYLVYVREIHPTEQSGTEKTENGDSADTERSSAPQIVQHATIEERITAASKCIEGLELTIPTLIDRMDNAALKAFHVWAAATVVIDVDGKVAFYSTGPRGTQPKKADKVIRKLLGVEENEPESPEAAKTTK